MDIPTENAVPQQPADAHMSRRERRMAKRHEQQSSQGSQQRKGMLKRVLFWGIGIAVIVGIGWGMVKLSQNVRLPSAGGKLAVPVSASDDAMGPADAPIVLVEYSDFQCPACGSFYPIVKQLLADPAVAGTVRFIYRNFPLTNLHANAQVAAQAAQAAKLQGKFWEMHDKLFENQAKWSSQSDAGARATFAGYAKDLGLNVAQFTRDIDSSAAKAKVQTDVNGGNAAAVNATPTFFVNGSQMAQPNSYDQFKQYVLAGLPVR